MVMSDQNRSAAEGDDRRRSQMDQRDLDILGDLVDVYDALDPMPPMLPEVVLFGLEISDLDAEIARLVDSEMSLAGASGTRSVEHAKRVTFSSDNLTVMISVQAQPDNALRLDGWAAPGGRLHAELRIDGATMTAECDETGRFVFESVPSGSVQLVLHPTDDSDPTIRIPVVTPALHL
jgi:hypothetical protein